MNSGDIYKKLLANKKNTVTEETKSFKIKPR